MTTEGEREPTHGLRRFTALQESVMTPKPDTQTDKPETGPAKPEREVSDPHPGSVSDGTHPEANEDKSKD
ncbi:hypothetical protein IMCC20628_04370 [Hoeflea sp. IMCC20628]|nr:hypothetical protein IMCC20628_04370 [Hoeflea sp. IMCC20628]